ncbi:uncharacterized protein [Procambarus clarkii]|uniref:uncharacterized protein n=1 Tax=Procambarus clarkii TaxID=6728 RepID=UPI003742CF37
MQLQYTLRRYKRGRLLRAVWVASVGVVGVTYILSSALYTSQLLQLLCESECTRQALEGCWSPESRVLVTHIRRAVLDKMQTQVAEPITRQELDDPPWLHLGGWMFAEAAIRQVFTHKWRGVFVEVGAGSGVFKSHTAWLETDRGWSGLLVEPRPEAYARLRLRRKALAARACVSDLPHTKKDVLWTPGHTEDLPDLYRDMALSKSTLEAYVAPEDKAGTAGRAVQCFTLDALAAAALGLHRTIDLVVLDTAGGEYMVLNTLQHLNILSLLIKYNTEVDFDMIVDAAKGLNLHQQHADVLQNEKYIFFLNPNSGINITRT